MRERWSLGAPFTARDATARDIAPILSLTTPRALEQWPTVKPQPVPAFNAALFPPNRPLPVLAKALFAALLELERSFGAKVPASASDPNITGAQATEIARNLSFSIFPGLR